MQAVHKFFLRFGWYLRFLDWTKIAVLPGFGSLPLYTIATFFFQEITKDSLAGKASSLSYNFMLAIFPAIIFIFTLIPYIPIEQFQDKLLSLIQPAFPRDAYSTLKSTLEDIIKNQNGGLLSFGFFAALFFSTNGVHHLMQAFNKSSLQIESRTWVKQRIVSITLTVLIVFALIFGLTIITAGEVVISFLEEEIPFKASFWAMLIRIVRWTILVIMYFVTISLLYRYGPANAKKWRFFSAGSWLATILAVLTFWGFGFYINNFGTYNKVYGSIGTLIVLMIWLYLNSLIILLGFELNASIDLSKRSIKIVKPKFNTFKRQEPEENLQKTRLR